MAGCTRETGLSRALCSGVSPGTPGQWDTELNVIPNFPSPTYLIPAKTDASLIPSSLTEAPSPEPVLGTPLRAKRATQPSRRPRFANDEGRLATLPWEPKTVPPGQRPRTNLLSEPHFTASTKGLSLPTAFSAHTAGVEGQSRVSGKMKMNSQDEDQPTGRSCREGGCRCPQRNSRDTSTDVEGNLGPGQGGGHLGTPGGAAPRNRTASIPPTERRKCLKGPGVMGRWGGVRPSGGE